jgi:hypothetical protein
VGSEFDFAGVLLWAGEVIASEYSWQPLACIEAPTRFCIEVCGNPHWFDCIVHSVGSELDFAGVLLWAGEVTESE